MERGPFAAPRPGAGLDPWFEERCTKLHKENKLNYMNTTVSVGEQKHKAVETGVRDLRDVGGTPADGLDGGRGKRLILALHIRLGWEGGREGERERSG